MTNSADYERLRKRLNKVPSRPGVYVFTGTDGRPLYVGKAKSLRDRLRTYFQAGAALDAKARTMLERVADFSFHVTDNEIEALVLEVNLIKAERPPFNVSYRDDKSFPFVAITAGQDFPRAFVTREPHRRGTRYFGPYTKAYAIRETIDTLRRTFPIRNCSEGKFARHTTKRTPCLEYHIRRCVAPCAGYVSAYEYREIVEQIIRFLEGKGDRVLAGLESDMNAAAASQDYERAARIRDRLAAARHVLERQKIVSTRKEDHDVVGIAVSRPAALGVGEGTAGAGPGVGETVPQGPGLGTAYLFQVRRGALIGGQSFPLRIGIGESDVLVSFLKQYYASATSIPPAILVPAEIEEKELVEAWLRERRGGLARIRMPVRGEKRRLVLMAEKNAGHSLALLQVERASRHEVWRKEASELARVLSLPVLPERIECFDVSSHRGREAVGSMVAFERGRPDTSSYRKFKIRHSLTVSDFAMMKEIVGRRLAALESGRLGFERRPDLVIVDGGKPQLSAALQALRELGILEIAVAALAKREEELYLAGRDQPIALPEGSPGLNLIKRVRNEAHRFAVSYHRGLRSRKMIESALDSIEGVGPERKRLLVRHFGRPQALAEASLAELEAAPGIPKRIAKKVYEALHKQVMPRGGKESA